MTNFHEILLPSFVNSYIVGGPSFDTSIVQTASGREVRHINTNFALQRYTIKNCKLSLDELEEFNAFFLNCKGAGFGFRLKDYADYKACRQELNCQDDGTFLLHKRYDFGGQMYLRRVFKPVRNSVEVFIDGRKTTLFYVCHENGTIKLLEEMKNGQTVSANFEFDVAARFLDDFFSYQFAKDGSVELSDIQLKEIIL